MFSEVVLFGLMNLHRMKRKIPEDFDRSKSKRKRTNGEFHYKNNEDKVHSDEIPTSDLQRIRTQNNEIQEEEDEDEEIRRDLQRRRRRSESTVIRDEDEDHASEKSSSDDLQRYSNIGRRRGRGIRAERRSEEDAAAQTEEEQTEFHSSSFRVERGEDHLFVAEDEKQILVFRDRATEAAQTEDRIYLVEEEGNRLFQRTPSNSQAPETTDDDDDDDVPFVPLQNDPSVRQRQGGTPTVQNDPSFGQDGQSVSPGTTLPYTIDITTTRGRREDPPDPAPVSVLILNPDHWWYRLWSYFIIVLAVFSSFFTPLEIAFFTDFPERSLFITDLVVAAAFVLDLGIQFFISYRDDQGLMVYHNRLIALRCLKSVFTYVDLLGCLPWDFIYVVCGREDRVRFCLWFRLYRAFRVMKFFQNIGSNYRLIRFLQIFVILLYYVHIGGCLFYYLATILPESNEIDTWIGSLALGADHFREIDFGRRYLISLYFAVITLTTIGYGDMHAVSDLEMIFTVIYVLPSMVVVPYLVNYPIVDM